MKKSRFIPYGYTVRNGRTVVEHTEATVIREIFNQYISGASLKEIAESLTARKIPYTEKKDVWNKARISRIIENAKYTGDGEYDPIIDEGIFETAVEELQVKINQELTKETPSEEYIVSLVSDMAGQMYKETDAKLMIAARVARQRTSMIVQQDEFAPDYFTDLISYVTLDGNRKVKLITKTETVIEEGTD